MGAGRRALFVRWMNLKARDLGMTDTHFARRLAALLRDDPALRPA